MPPILFSLLALALFKGDMDGPDNSAARLQIMFLIAFSAFIFGLLFAIQEIVKEFPIFRRERMVNLGIVPYVLSKTTFLAPLLALLILVMVGILRSPGVCRTTESTSTPRSLRWCWPGWSGPRWPCSAPPPCPTHSRRPTCCRSGSCPRCCLGARCWRCPR